MIDITYDLECLPEDTQIKGHAMASGDPAFDAETNAHIRAELKSGNEWAWFCAHVIATVTIDGHTFTGHDYLGCCSYESEQAFRDDPYFADMKLEAKQALIKELIRAVKAGDVAAQIIKQIS